MTITIRDATDADFPAILALVKELATFQQATDKVIVTADEMLKDKDLFRCLIAENDQQEIIGIATYFFAYYTWVGKSLYLDDLYVKQQYRGNKTGSLLLKRLFEIAIAAECKRVRWQVSDWNEPAINFYKKLGGHIDKEPYNCDFEEPAMRAFKI
jgi:GNAT superfamily N-acetyltransferase